MRAYSGFLHKYFNWLGHLVERSAYTAVTSISGHNCQVVHMSKSVCKIMPLLLPQHSRWYQWIYDALTHSTLVLYQCLLCYCFYTSVSYLLAISWLFENLNFECWNLIDMLIVTLTILYCLFVTCTKKHADHAIPFPTEWGKLWTNKDCFYTSFPSWQVTIKINPYMLLLLLQYIYILWQTAMSDMRVGVHASYLTICKTLLNDISTRGGKSVSEDF